MYIIRPSQPSHKLSTVKSAEAGFGRLGFDEVAGPPVRRPVGAATAFSPRYPRRGQVAKARTKNYCGCICKCCASVQYSGGEAARVHGECRAIVLSLPAPSERKCPNPDGGGLAKRIQSSNNGAFGCAEVDISWDEQSTDRDPTGHPGLGLMERSGYRLDQFQFRACLTSKKRHHPALAKELDLCEIN